MKARTIRIISLMAVTVLIIIWMEAYFHRQEKEQGELRSIIASEDAYNNSVTKMLGGGDRPGQTNASQK
jgi:hypothetical protein